MNAKTTHEKPCCPHCGKDDPKKHGTTTKGTQRFVCRHCHRSFVKDKPAPFNSVITKNLIVKTYKETDKSLRQIADEYSISHQTVKNWVKESQKDVVGFKKGILDDFIRRIGATFTDFEDYIDKKKYSLSDEFTITLNEKKEEILTRFDDICEFKKMEVLKVLDGEFNLTRNLLRDYLERRFELLQDTEGEHNLEEIFDENMLKTHLNNNLQQLDEGNTSIDTGQLNSNGIYKKEETFEIISEILEEEESLLYNVMKESFGEEPANVLLEKERKERLMFLDRLKHKVIPTEPETEQTSNIISKKTV